MMWPEPTHGGGWRDAFGISGGGGRGWACRMDPAQRFSRSRFAQAQPRFDRTNRSAHAHYGTRLADSTAIFWPMVTKDELAAAAAEVSAADGFEAVTVERLAGDLRVPEREVSDHFPTDELLQQSIVWAGAEVFKKAVTEPANSAPDGIERLRALLTHWVDYAESDTYRGGFVGGAADLPGHIKDLIARIARSWIETLAGHARLAVEQGELPSGTDPHQIAFEVHGLVQEANWTFRVLSDVEAYNRARRGIENRLGSQTYRPPGEVIRESRGL